MEPAFDVEVPPLLSRAIWEPIQEPGVRFLPRACYRSARGAVCSTTPNCGLLVRFDDGGIYHLSADEAIKGLARDRAAFDLAKDVAGLARPSRGLARAALLLLAALWVVAFSWLWLTALDLRPAPVFESLPAVELA